MWRYYRLLTDKTADEIAALEAAVSGGQMHPKQAKVDLAHAIVTEFHDAAAASHAAAEFDRVHARGELPSDLREVVVMFEGDADVALTRILADAGLAASTSEAGRKIQQGGVRVNGEKVSDMKFRIRSASLPLTLQAGRHAVRLVAR
jgi:tyrosyl-tRNA synthetase